MASISLDALKSLAFTPAILDPVGDLLAFNLHTAGHILTSEHCCSVRSKNPLEDSEGGISESVE